MILTLQKLDVPISVIKDFLQNRSKQKLLELLEEQERFYIEKPEKIKNHIEYRLYEIIFLLTEIYSFSLSAAIGNLMISDNI